MTAGAAVAFTVIFWPALTPQIPEKRVVIDAGHGGNSPFVKGRLQKSDRWDPLTKQYLSYYAPGMAANGYHEHLVMIALAHRLNRYLNWTTSALTWPRFEALLRQFAEQEQFPRIIIRTKMTRLESWNQRFKEAENRDVNSFYRMFDYPDQRGRMRHGRLSLIEQFGPSLVVSLHMTPAGPGHEGGMAAVIAPGFRTLDLIRKIHLGEAAFSEWERSPWRGRFLVIPSESRWSQYEIARADIWGYFHGYRSNRDGTGPNFEQPRGIRHNLISWRYADPPGWIENYDSHAPGPFALNYRQFQPVGKFWQRERQIGESWRREEGPLGYGGDNHYAADELMRFVQYGVRLLSPEMQTLEAIGPIQPPYASTYTLPIYLNAIVALLEIGYLNRERDRYLVLEHREQVAQSLAVGIYALYCGLKLRTLPTNPFPVKGQPLDFEKYRRLPQGDYFRGRPHSSPRRREC